jgi:2-polyprenyl-6-methoxyphenol hydroxylase-like FAD-dependent oxidoreductase
VIVGSGISGTLAATVLGRTGLNLCLIDRHEVYPRDFRAEHLDGRQIDQLWRLGLLEDLTDGLYRGETVTVARFGRTVGAAPTINFGQRYETMVNRARATLPPTVTVMTGRVTNVTTSDSMQHVRMSDGRAVNARLVVLATGQGYSLCRQLGIIRRVLREAHSLTFGFDIEPLGGNAFSHSFLIYQPEKIQDRIDYLSAFTLGKTTRINLFTYRNYREPWTKAFMADPDAGLDAALPGLRHVTGPFQAVGPVVARPMDLYVSEGYRRDGVVVIGDAFQSSCPATGMGMVRLLTDIERLSGAHIPTWLMTPGMSAEKIATFYGDPIKVACDAQALHDAEYRRAVSTETTLRWSLHRARVHAVERLRAWFGGRSTSSHSGASGTGPDAPLPAT